MRLYNATSCTPATGTQTPSASSFGLHHFNQQPKAPLKPARPWRLKEASAATRLQQQQEQRSGSCSNNKTTSLFPASSLDRQQRQRDHVSPKRTRKLQATWPPPSTAASMSFESVVPANTNSTVSTSSETPLNPSQEPSRTKETIKEEIVENSIELRAGLDQEENGGDSLEPTSGKTKDCTREGHEGEEPRPVKSLQRKFTSAFQSPLRLAKIQFRSSPGHRLFQRLQGGGKKEQEQRAEVTATLLETRNRSSHLGFSQEEEQPTLQCDPILSTDDTAEETPAPNNFHDRTSLHTFQSPLKKFHLKQMQQHSPQLSKNETSTTATNETFDCLPGRISSESFHFDIELVKSTDEAAAAEMLDNLEPEAPRRQQPKHHGGEEHASLISKSSSSTLTSHWYEEQHLPSKHSHHSGVGAERNLTTGSGIDRPIAPAPWASIGDFVLRSETDDFIDPGFADPQYPPPIDVPRRRISEDRPPSGFDRAGSGDTWSDGDSSWIDFTADPFKTIRTTGIAKPSASKPSPPAPAAVMSSLLVQEPTLNKDLLLAPLQETTLPGLSTFVPIPYQENKAPSTPIFHQRGNTRAASPGNRHPESDEKVPQPPNDTKGHSPLLLGSLLQSRYEMGHQQLNKLTAKPLPATTPEVVLAETSREKGIDKALELPEKYAKMLKMGLPEGAVRNAMLRDGVDASALDDPDSVPLRAHRPSSSPGTIKPDLDQYRRFRVHWEPHENVRSNTVWAMAQREEPWISENIQVDEDEYKKLFQETKDPLLKRVVRNESSGTIMGGTVIDAKRANNGGIVLARIKLSCREIAKAIDQFDYDAFSADQIKALLPLLPTTGEEGKLRDVISKSGDNQLLKSECERFMVSVLGVREAKEKLNSMLFMKQFSVVVDGLKRDSRLVQSACDEVMSSSRLRRLLGVLLQMGNRLNSAGQSRKVKASAVRLQSLARLSQGKAFDRKTTFLQYVAGIMHRSSPDSVQLRDELPTLRCAEKVGIDQMKEDVAELEARITGLRQMALRMGGGALSPEVEVEVLHSTPIGRFTLDACLKMASVYNEMEGVKQAYSTLLHYFGEGQPEGAPLPNVFCLLSIFCNQLETAVEKSIAQDRAARRGLNRKGCRVSYNTGLVNPRRPSTEPRSGIGSVLDAIRCKAFNPSTFDL